MKTVPNKASIKSGRGPYNNACDVCRDRKVKCDGNQPVCNTCQLSNRHSECSWVKNPTRKPRTEQLFESLHKRAENLQTLLHEYRRYTEHLESLLDQTPYKTGEFRSSRPSDPYDLMRSWIDHDFDDFDFIVGDDESAVMSSEESTDEFCRPFSYLTLEEDGRVNHYGLTAIFRFMNNKSELSKQPSRFPAIVEDPHETYVLIVDAASEKSYNPDFEWSRHLPSEVPLDRKSHDKALDLLFKFFTSWCLRMVPALFLRDMYRALRLPRSRNPPKTPHYSPMLHNSLIALALAFLDDPKFRDLKSRQYFAEKAKSFTEAECQKPNISVVQALSFLGSFHSSQGDQTLGYLYFGMSVRVAQALGLNVDCTELVTSGHMEESDRLDRNWANWTIFGQDVCWSLYVGRNYSVPVPDPDFPMPMVDIALDQMPWTHEPAGMDSQPNYLTKTFEASCELLKISRRIMDVNNFLTRKKTRTSVIDEVISGIDVKLNTWRGSLPQELEITVKSRPTSTPHKLMLHLIYWWMFILLHRPFFHRKARQIASADREIDHVKLCRRAADNIMENLATWRTLYDLRYCPVTLVQTVFSAGTVYLLTAMRASSGVRVAQKELGHAMTQQDLVMQYLSEIGKSWQCATNIAGILKGLMQDQLAPRLERRALLHNDSLQVPNDKEEGKVSPTRPISIPRRNSRTKRRLSVSRGTGSQTTTLDTPPRTSVSPTITFSLVNSKAPNHSVSSSPQDYLSPTTLSGPSFSSRSPSLNDIQSWRNTSRTKVGNSPASSHRRRLSDASAQSVTSSPSTSFQVVQSTFQYSPPSMSHHIGHEMLSRNDALASSEHIGHEIISVNDALASPEHIPQTNAVQVHSPGQIINNPGQSPSTSSYLPDAFTDLQVILGGHTIPPTPFLSSFSLGEGGSSTGPTTDFDMSLFEDSHHQSQSGGNGFNYYASSGSMEPSNANGMDLDQEDFDQWLYGTYWNERR